MEQNEQVKACTIHQKIIEVDTILYGTWLYGHHYSGQMEIFLDHLSKADRTDRKGI